MSAERLSVAGNVFAPAYLALRELGCAVHVQRDGDGRETWSATRGDLSLVAGDPLELLGLHCLHQERGPDWKASDAEIDDFRKRFGHGTPA
jgi:hypothetical protein